MHRLLIGRPRVLAAATALLGLLGVAAASFALISTLPGPTHGERLGVDVVRSLQSSRGRGAVIHLGRTVLVASCRPLSGSRRAISLSNGERLLLAGTRLRETASPRRSSARRLAGRRAAAHASSPALLELAAMKAGLAGSYAFYSAALKTRLMRGKEVFAGRTTFRGVPAFRIRLGADRPQVELVVDRRTLSPLAVTYRSRRASGWSRLLPAPPGARGC